MIGAAPVLPGETLAGKYRVERVLGKGGMGIVMAARHLELDERVAIKFLLGERTDGGVERFLREARAAAKVKGEHVCRVFDFGRLETGEPYIVMEHLEGTDLARKLDREGPQPAEVAVGWIVEACDALAEAHAIGIVHRDLKPANIFLAERTDGSSCAKVLDFGISKLSKAETMTGTATMMGSPVYMSPEQMESARDVDARSDVWSLGVMLYELIAGKPPFIGESMVQLSVMVRERREEPLELVKPGVPEGLARIVTQCLEKRPEDRFGSVADLAAALGPFAPPEVSALVARLVRRTTPSSSQLALDRTAPDTRASAPSDAPAASPTETSQPLHLARARGTFAPLQSTLGEVAVSRAASARRWPVALGGILLVAAGALGTRALTSSSSVDVAPEAASSARVSMSAEEPGIATAASSPASAPAPAVASTQASESPPPTATPPTLPPVMPRPPVAALAASAAPPPSASSPALPPSASAPVASKPPPAGDRKRRELDRDDP
jgi:eukaryotic-like serine/threonine-protein kinase